MVLFGGNLFGYVIDLRRGGVEFVCFILEGRLFLMLGFRHGLLGWFINVCDCILISHVLFVIFRVPDDLHFMHGDCYIGCSVHDTFGLFC